MAERTPRYTAEQRAQFAANNRAAAAGAKYGTSYAAQGYRPEKEMGQAYLKKQELKAKYGAFANPTWDYQVVNGVLMRRPKPGQTGRIAEQGGTAQWEAAPDYAQRAFSNPRRQAFFAQNPELAGQPGGGQDAWVYQRYLNTLQTDPTTGYKVNPAGELYDPRALLPGGSGRGQVEGFAGQGGFPGAGSSYNTGFGGYGQPGGYIPGYAMPQGFGGYGSYGLRPRTPNMPNYRTLQQQGGSTFGTYPAYGQGY